MVTLVPFPFSALGLHLTWSCVGIINATTDSVRSSCFSPVLLNLEDSISSQLIHFYHNYTSQSSSLDKRQLFNFLFFSPRYWSLQTTLQNRDFLLFYKSQVHPVSDFNSFTIYLVHFVTFCCWCNYLWNCTEISPKYQQIIGVTMQGSKGSKRFPGKPCLFTHKILGSSFEDMAWKIQNCWE